jgi:heme/copper-type cytochrome/quinol oxidase subunit 2
MLISPIRWAVLVAAALLVMLAPLPPGGTTPADRHFTIEASQFSFEPGTLVVNPGDRVTLELRSTDVVHGLYLDGYDVSVSADPGRPATLSFVADRAGSFRFRCSVPCGDIHPFMIGRLRVGPNVLLLRGLGLVLVVAAWSLLLAQPVRRPAG